jgi:fluoride exporter
MTALTVLAVGAVGGAGAIARFLLDGAVSRRTGRDFPYGTFAVNIAGSLALGVVAGVALSGDGYRIVATGLLGAFTTFSTWAFESHRLAEDGEPGLGAVNFAVSLAVGIVAVWAGRHIGAAL